MVKRVRLTWNRNLDPETDHYRIFRKETPDILEQNRMESLVMRVAHPKAKNPVRMTGERVKRLSPRTYQLAHKNILLALDKEKYPFELQVDGKISTRYTLDTIDGKIMFDEDIAPESKVIATEYTFDGVEAWDYAIEEKNKTYYGPDAKDTAPPSPPTNLELVKDLDNNKLTINWSPSITNGKTFYYRIDAAASSKRASMLSEMKAAKIAEGLTDRPYIVERSEDGVRWLKVAKVKTTSYNEYMVDRQAPDMVRNFKSSAYLHANQSLAQVTLNWERVRDTVLSTTALYRVRAMNKMQAISEPSNIIGPVPFQVKLKEIVIRRKVFDGTLPTFDGADAVTVAKIGDLGTTQYVEDVTDNIKYTYGIWVVDAGDNVSPTAYTTIEIGDATPPAFPMNLTVEPFQLIVG